MLNQETYEIAAEVFGTVIGVASIKKIKEVDLPAEVKKWADMDKEEVLMNTITTKAIGMNKYQKLHRTIYRLRKDRRKKEITIYKQAWKEILND
jgi:hypothetical protein